MCNDFFAGFSLAEYPCRYTGERRAVHARVMMVRVEKAWELTQITPSIPCAFK